MSADNAIFVWKASKGDGWCTAHGFMSPACDDCMYMKELEKDALLYPNRSQALIGAHNQAKEFEVLEYGVIEDEVPSEPCGNCYGCQSRYQLAEDVERCDKCNTPLLGSMVLTSKGKFCHKCEPKIR